MGKKTSYVPFNPWNVQPSGPMEQMSGHRLSQAAPDHVVDIASPPHLSSRAEDVLPLGLTILSIRANASFDSEGSKDKSVVLPAPPLTPSGYLEDSSSFVYHTSPTKKVKPCPLLLQPPPSSFQCSSYPSTPSTPGISPTLPSLPPHDRTLLSRRPIQSPPIPGKVYFMPDGRHLPNSIIHGQKRQNGFFKHPMLIVEVEGNTAYFYALTKAPPHAIGELKMCLRMGTNTMEEGAGVLRLAESSFAMKSETWVNLEQRFFIEWKNLDDWADDVQIDSDDLRKIWYRIQELEADQNRYIYKPLLRDLSQLEPGTVVMLPNKPRSATLGAPIVILENNYPRFRFLRVKVLDDNIHFNKDSRKTNGSTPDMCLQISKEPRMGHDGTPVMLLEPDSPDMREPSYVELGIRAKTGMLSQCKTWCWPPVKVCKQSMMLMKDYINRMATVIGSQPPSRVPSVAYPSLPSTPGIAHVALSSHSGNPHIHGDARAPPQFLQHNDYQHAGNAYRYSTLLYTPFGAAFPGSPGYITTNGHMHLGTYKPHNILLDEHSRPYRCA